MIGSTCKSAFLVLCAAAWLGPIPCKGGELDAEISGTVSVLSTQPVALMPGATVWFRRSDGQNFKATTDGNGQYKILLNPGYDYSVAVGGGELCAKHRSPFRAKPGSILKFDFTTTIFGIIDWITVVNPHPSKGKADRSEESRTEQITETICTARISALLQILL